MEFIKTFSEISVIEKWRGEISVTEKEKKKKENELIEGIVDSCLYWSFCAVRACNNEKCL